MALLTRLVNFRPSTPSDSSYTRQSRSESPRYSAGTTGCQYRWKSSLPWHPSAAECGRHISLPIHLPCHFAKSNCWTGRSSGRRSRPFGSLPCGRSGRLPLARRSGQSTDGADPDLRTSCCWCRPRLGPSGTICRRSLRRSRCGRCR